MEIVKLYDVSVHEVAAYDGRSHVDVAVASSNNFRPFYDGEDLLLVDTKSLPIQHYKWSNGKECFAVFSDELLEIIGVEQGAQQKLDEERTLTKLLSEELELVNKENLHLTTLPRKFKDISLLKRIRFLFTGRIE